MRRFATLCAIAASAACLWGATTANAASVATTLTAENGFGAFDDTLACPGGDGPSWAYLWSGTSSASIGPLSGTWHGFMEVHRGTDPLHAYVPSQGGLVGIDLPTGRINLGFDGGTCAAAPLALSSAGDEPTVSGSLPFHVTGGSGDFRSITGSGTATISAELTKGADNHASIGLSGNLSVLQPHFTVSDAIARYASLGDYLGRRISVYVSVTNDGPPATTGDAYNVTVSNVSVAGAGGTAVSGPVAHLAPGASGDYGISVSGVNPATVYTMTLKVTAKDALGGSTTPVTVTRTFRTPLTPLNIL